MTARIDPAQGAPSWVTVFNPVTRRLLKAGAPLGPNALVTIRGRSTGQPHSTPLAIIRHAGRRWVWSPWGDSQWVRNLRAVGHATITVRGGSEDVRAIELDPSQRVEFFRDVLGPVAHSMPFGTTFVRVVDGVDLSDPEGVARDRRVFELVDR